MRGPAVVGAAAALAVTAAACGSGGDKAGGRPSGGRPLVLTLEQSDPTYAGAQFAAAVAKRSGGSIRIDVSPDWHREGVEFERGVVEDVRAGKSDLGVIGVRVWDTLGVTSFQALIAPFLVDNLELERRVLEGPLAARMLAGLDRSGVVGVALLPGPLRRPFGYTRALVSRDDYKGARLGVYPGRVEEATFRSLGATTRRYLNLRGASREGAVLNFWAIAGGSGYRGKTLATNVVFWPRPETVVINRRAFEALTPAQQEILRDAGREAVGRRLAEVDRIEQDALRTICDRRLASFVTVPPEDVAALHEGVRPVYAELERNGETRELIGEIRALRATTATHREPLRCPEAGAGVASALAGRWQATATGEEVLAAGATPREVARGPNSMTLQLESGKWVARGVDTGRTWTGRYTVSGDVIRLTLETCSHNPCTPGALAEHGWSVYRDTLSLTRLPGQESWWQLIAKPFKRAH